MRHLTAQVKFFGFAGSRLSLQLTRLEAEDADIELPVSMSGRRPGSGTTSEPCWIFSASRSSFDMLMATVDSEPFLDVGPAMIVGIRDEGEFLVSNCGTGPDPIDIASSCERTATLDAQSFDDQARELQGMSACLPTFHVGGARENAANASGPILRAKKTAQGPISGHDGDQQPFGDVFMVSSVRFT